MVERYTVNVERYTASLKMVTNVKAGIFCPPVHSEKDRQPGKCLQADV
jgi:hypothetical protein